MNKNIALKVSGIVFAIVALAHLIRIYYHSHIVVSGYTIPMEVSYIGFIIALVLSIWMFIAR
jgi:hypothetical protein